MGIQILSLKGPSTEIASLKYKAPTKRIAFVDQNLTGGPITGQTTALSKYFFYIIKYL